MDPRSSQRTQRQKPFLDGVHALRGFAALAIGAFHAGGALTSETLQGLA